MPTITRWFVKTSFVCLAAALLAGILLGLQSVLALSGLGGIFPVYIHLLVFGWLTQLIFGIAFWMFPKFNNDRPRGSERLAWWSYGLLNAGLLLRLVAEPVHSMQADPVTGWMLVVSAALQFSAGAAFVLNTWPRVKGR